MARRWVVLTVDRDPHNANEIITYTEWDGYMALADEVIYTDPVDADGNAVDALWKVSGSVTRTGAGTAADPYIYTYADNSLEPSLIDRQRGQIFDAYLYWRIFGRTQHWAGLRAIIRTSKDGALDATDKWAVHILALVDQAIHGAFPLSGAYTPEALQAFINHAENILRTLGPTWYFAQFQPEGENAPGEPSMESGMYAALQIDSGQIYTDIVTIQGVLRVIDGDFISMGTSIRDGFNPESRTLGN